MTYHGPGAFARYGALQLLVWSCPDGHGHLEIFEHGPQRAWRSFEPSEAEARVAAEQAARIWPPPPGMPGRSGFGDGGDDPEERGHSAATAISAASSPPA